MNFEAELRCLLNRHSKENGSNTPDFILVEYLVGCLDNFDRTTRNRELWYGKRLEIPKPELKWFPKIGDLFELVEEHPAKKLFYRGPLKVLGVIDDSVRTEHPENGVCHFRISSIIPYKKETE